MKQYLGLVELDEHGNILLDDKGEPVMNKYPKFSQFRKQVLDVVREDLNRMASRSETDIVFDEFLKKTLFIGTESIREILNMLSSISSGRM